MKITNGNPWMRWYRAGGLLGVTAVMALFPPGLRAAVLFGRVVECGGTASAAGYVVQGFEVVRTGHFVRTNCNVSDPVTRNVGTDTTGDDGKYNIVYTATERDDFHCFFERNAYIQVFLPDGTTLIHTSPLKTGGGEGFFDVAFPDFTHGSPGGCPETRFIFSFDGPSEVSGPAGTNVSFEATVLLDTEFAGTPALHGAEGWIFNAAAGGGTVIAATTAGTLAASVDDDPPGLATSCSSSFRRLATATEGPECADLTAVQAGAIIRCSADSPAGLPVEGVLPSILRVTVEAVMPAQGAQGVCRLFFPENCRVLGPVTFDNEVLFQGLAIPPFEKRELLVTLRGDNPPPLILFRRADANGSADVDISDAVSTLSWLFSGTEEPDCLAAADSNDSGDIDLSDAVYTLNWLFGSGERPPSPGPFECGSDATPDRLPACVGTGC